MKIKILLTAIMAGIFAGTSLAQNFTYSFTNLSGTFTELSSATSLNNGQTWWQPQYQVPIEFDFTMFGQPIDTIFTFNNIIGGLWAAIPISNPLTFISPIGADLIDRGYFSGPSVSPLRYKTEGSIGNRILKIEWKNAGSRDEYDSLGTLNDFVSFQLWLYEDEDIIELHYGPSSVNSNYIFYDDYYGGIGANVCLGGFDQQNGDLVNLHCLEGNVNSPTMVDSMVQLTGTPPNGSIYRFFPISTGIPSFEANNIFSVYPNPTNGIFTISHSSWKSSLYEIIDITGKIIQKGKLTGYQTRMDLSENEIGVYLLKIDGQITKLLRQ